MTAPTTGTTAEDRSVDLIERFRSGNCPFCGHDPYHYVDVGVGYERVAVTCCDLGIALFQHGDEQLVHAAGERHEAANALDDLLTTLRTERTSREAAEARVAELEAALRPFAKSVVREREGDGIHIFLSFTAGELRRARAALNQEPTS